MSRAVLRKSFERLFECSFLGPQLTVVWHAGEPMAVPISFYREAVQMVDEINRGRCEIEFNIQTNGTLITPEWCEFIKESGFRIGVSLDGPEFVHDASRRRRSGIGTHRDVMRGLDLFRRYQINFHVICVVTQHSLEFAEEIYTFFKDIGVDRIGLNIEEIEGMNREGSFLTSDHDKRLRQFLRTLSRLWILSPTRPRIREFNGIVANIVAEGRDSYVQDGTPFCILNVDVKGNFAPFSPELMGHTTHHGKFWFGNVMTHSFDDLSSDQRLENVYSEILSGFSKCESTCKYFCLCGGGKPSNKFSERGTFDCTETRYCITNRQILLEEVLYVLEEETGISSPRT